MVVVLLRQWAAEVMKIRSSPPFDGREEIEISPRNCFAVEKMGESAGFLHCCQF